MPTSDTAENVCGIGEQVVLLTRLADEFGGRADGWSSTLAPARGRPVLEVVSLATRRGARVVAEAGSLWWWPQVVEIGSASDVSGAATQVAAVLGVFSSPLEETARDRLTRQERRPIHIPVQQPIRPPIRTPPETGMAS